MTTQTESEQLAEKLERNRRAAFLRFMRSENDKISKSDYSYADDNRYSVGGREWLVLTDSEATEACIENIEQSVWAFNADFLSDCIGCEKKAISAVQAKCSEDCNDLLCAAIRGSKGGMERFCRLAISADGRGHFLAQYDNEENEQGEFFVYRVN